MDPKKLLLTLLNLPDGASDEDIEKAARTLAEKMDKSADTEKVEALSSSVEKISQSLDELRKNTPEAKLPEQVAKDLQTLTARLDDIEKNHEARERDIVKRDALAAGKIVPLSADKLSLEDYRAFVADLPANQVPLDKRTPDGIKALASTGLPGHSDAAEAVRTQLGISKEDWDKHHAAS